MRPRDPTAEERSSKQIRVLFAEDNPADVKLMVATLKRGGYTLVADRVDTFASFVHQVANVNYDLIISDHSLPNWSIVEALEFVRGSGKEIPVIVVTGALDDASAVECMKHGATDYILKDRMARLPTAVERALKERVLIRERKLAEEALRRSEQEYRMLFHNNPLPMWVYDLETLYFLEVNEAAIEHYGYSKDEFLAMTITDIRPPEDIPALLANVSQASEGIGRAGVWRHRKRNGQIIEVEIISHPMMFAGRRAEIILANDVTERRRAEAENRRLAIAIEQAAEAVVITDVQGTILYVNPAFAEITGYTSAETLGQSTRLLKSGAHAPEFYEGLWMTIKSGKVWHGEIVNRRKDGSLYTEAMTVAPVRDSSGVITNYIAIKQDISARKQAEAARARLAAIVESSDDAIIGKTLDGIIQSWNAGAERLYGYSAEEVTGRPVTILLPPDRPDDVQSILQRIRKGESVDHYETVRARKGGQLVHVSLTVSPIRDLAGKVVGASTIARDVTERKQVAELLSNSEERFRTIFESAGIGMALVDMQGHLVRCNPALQKMIGYSEEEGRGMTFLEFTHPDDRELDWSLYSQLAAGELDRYESEKRYIKKNGDVLPAHVIVSLVKDLRGVPEYAVGMVEDITERKRAEDALRRSEERFRKAFDTAPEPMTISTAVEGRYIDVNERFLSVTGYRREEVIGRTSFDINFWHDPSNREDFVKVLQATGRVQDMEITFLNKSGHPRQGLLSAESIELNGQKCFLSVTKDMTERKELEQQLRQAQKMEAVGQLAGGVAHDFNNLLTVINGYSHVMLERLKLNDPTWRYVSEIKKAGDRAASLTRQLLAFSRKQVLVPEILNLNKIIESLGMMLQRLIGEDIELVAVQARDLGLVKADPGQIEQIILNLAVNARDAMPKGGKLTIETANVELDAHYAHDHTTVVPGPFVMLAMSDTGHGMDAETQKHIFEPFFTTKGPGKGTGLGLSTVYGIVKQSGGTIWVYSEPQHGTSFKVYLPRVDEPAAVTERPALEEGDFTGTETILLVEDEESVRVLVRETLESKGYRVLEAISGVDALLISDGERGSPIHVLMTDVVMPDISGREIAERIVKARPGTKVLYMSGYADDAVVRHGVLEATVAFIQKPFTPEALARKLREVIAGPPAPRREKP